MEQTTGQILKYNALQFQYIMADQLIKCYLIESTTMKPDDIVRMYTNKSICKVKTTTSTEEIETCIKNGIRAFLVVDKLSTPQSDVIFKEDHIIIFKGTLMQLRSKCQLRTARMTEYRSNQSIIYNLDPEVLNFQTIDEYTNYTMRPVQKEQVVEPEETDYVYSSENNNENDDDIDDVVYDNEQNDDDPSNILLEQ